MPPRSHGLPLAALSALAAACAPLPGEPELSSRTDALGVLSLSGPFDFAQLPTTTPTLSAGLSATSTAPVDVTFEWSPSPLFTPAASALVTVAPGGTQAAYTLSAAQALGNGATVHWRARAVEGTASSPWTAARSLTVAAGLPGPAWHATTEAQLRASPPATLAQITTEAAGGGALVVGFEATPVFSDDFESGTLAAWTITNAAPPTTDVTNTASPGAPSGSRVMKSVDADTGGSGAQAYRDWGAPLGRGAIDFWARVDAAGPRASGGFLRGGVTAFAASLIWGSPPLSLRYVDDRSFITELVPPVPVAANTWRRYRMEYLDRGPYDLFVDGVRAGTALPMQSSNDLTRFAVHTSSTYPDVISDYEVDDVAVYRGALSGIWTSPPIAAADLGGQWRLLSFTGVVAAGQPAVRVQVEVPTGATTWGLAPESELPGNAAGFTSPGVPLAGLSSTIRPVLRVKVMLARLAVTDPSPRVDDLTVTAVPPGGVDGGPDAGAPDAGADAGTLDAGADAGSADAGAADAGAADAGAADGGPTDAGSSTEAGIGDAGATPDAGPTDGGASGEPLRRTFALGCGCGAGSGPLVLLALLWPCRRRRASAPGHRA